MRRVLVLSALILVGAVSVGAGAGRERGPSYAGQPRPSASDIQVDRIRDNLYLFRGGGGNTAALITANGVILVDTKLAGWGKAIIDRLQEITDKPVVTIVNTHTHFDHVSGNVEFPQPVEVVAHENTAQLMREMRPVTGGLAQVDVFKASGGRGLPRRTFSTQLTLGTGEERIELHYFGRAHTGGDTWVVFPALRVVHCGDAFALKTVPIIDANNGGSGIEYANTLAKAAALPDIDTVLAGHHPSTLTMADLKVYVEFNRDFVQAVQAAKKAGRTLDDVVNTWTVADRFLKEGYLSADDFLRLTRQPISAQVRANAEVVWNETK